MPPVCAHRKSGCGRAESKCWKYGRVSATRRGKPTVCVSRLFLVFHSSLDRRRSQLTLNHSDTCNIIIMCRFSNVLFKRKNSVSLIIYLLFFRNYFLNNCAALTYCIKKHNYQDDIFRHFSHIIISILDPLDF
jgi:hypothetical protein